MHDFQQVLYTENFWTKRFLVLLRLKKYLNILLHIFMIVTFPIVNGYCMSLLQFQFFFFGGVLNHSRPPDFEFLHF